MCMFLGNYSHDRQSVKSSVIHSIRMSMIFKLAKFRNVVTLRMQNEKPCTKTQ